MSTSTPDNTSASPNRIVMPRAEIARRAHLAVEAASSTMPSSAMATP
jgi:hypothetical protein